MAEIVAFPRPLDRLANALDKAAEPLPVVYPETSRQAALAMRTARAFVGKLTPELLAQATALEWVQAPTASLEHYVFPALVDHSCTLTNVAGIFGDVVAEHTLGYVLSFTRNLHHYRDRQNDGVYQPVGADELTPDFVGGPQVITPVDRAHRRVCDCRFLIVGLGGIGRAIASTLHLFGANCDGVDPVATIAAVGECVGRVLVPDEIDQHLANYDFVIVAAPHTPTTAGWFNAERLKQMNPNAVLINVGRGAIVELAALESALERGQLGGAALDVFETEPLPETSPLWKMPNVLITPHVAACCDQISRRQGDLIAENMKRFVRGEPLRNVVDKKSWF